MPAEARSTSHNLSDRIMCGDAVEVLATFPEASIDLVVTDPPYGYGFMGKEWDKAVPPVTMWKECLRVLKPGGFAFVMSAPRQDVLAEMVRRLAMAGFVTGFTSLYWTYSSGFPKALDVSKAVDKRRGAKRQTLGHRRLVDMRGGRYGSANATLLHRITGGPVTPEAKALDGAYSGFQPKPAVEVIIVAMKPILERTCVDQAVANRKGVTWLADCRIPYAAEDDRSGWHTTGADGSRGYLGTSTFRIRKVSAEEIRERTRHGRFPANLLVSDRVLDYAPSANGSSRYFDLDMWSRDRIAELPDEARHTLPWFIVPKASRSERDCGLMHRNPHPTVKPIRLMSYLITLGSRADDVVLDPFVGSGTTCIAARLLGRRYVGVDANAAYVKVARRRTEASQRGAKLQYGTGNVIRLDECRGKPLRARDSSSASEA